MDFETIKKSGEWDDLIKKLDKLEIPLEKITEFSEQDFMELGIGIVRQAKLKALIGYYKDIKHPARSDDIVLNHPTIISHEYARLFDLLERKQYFGLLLQIKDVFEVILKFPTLLAVADIFHKSTRTRKENRLLLKMFERQLTLGNWEYIARTITKLEKTEPLLIDLLKMLIKEYDSNQIRKWRNDRIGHGALALRADEAFLSEIHSKITLITEILEKCNPFYQQMSFYSPSAGQHILELVGKEVLGCLSGKMHLYVKINKKLISGYPLILIDDQSIYFYDSYLPRMRTVSMLDYIQGDKLESFADMEQWLEKNIVTLEKEATLDSIKEQTSLDNEAYSVVEESIYDKLKDIDDFLEPKALTRWFSSILSNNKKGVFLIQMERGMGKSTFTRSLDDFTGTYNSIKLKNTLIRGYYINDSYTYRPHVFTQKTNDILRMDRKNNLIIGGIEAVSSKSSCKSKDFADLLNQYSKEYKSGRYSQKVERILLIIDGLDEIPATNQDSIFDFIPTPEQLSDGVFIIITCRTNHEVSTFTTDKLKKLTLTGSKEFTTASPAYQEVILDYINKEIMRYLTRPEDRVIIAEQSEYRFLYVRAFKELFENTIITNTKDMPKTKALIPTYLNHLQTSYGAKYYKKLIDLLIAIGSSFEPVTMRELAYLNGENLVTFNLLAYVLDINLFLRVERSKRGNVFSLSHDDWNRSIEQLFKNNIEAFSKKQVEKILGQIGKNIQWSDQKNDGLTYILAYLPDYIDQANIDVRLTDEQILTIKTIAAQIAANSLKEYQRERALLIYNTVLMAEKTADNFPEITKTLLYKGNIHQTLMQYDDAMLCYNEALQISDESEAATKAQLLAAKGALSRERGNCKEGIGLLSQALETLKLLQRQKQLPTSEVEALATIYKDRGYAKRLTGSKNLLDEALQDLEKAYQLYQDLIDKDSPIKEEDYSSVVMNRGAVFNDMGHYEQAIADYEKAREIRERLLQSDNMRDKSLLCSTLMNLGYAYFCADNINKGEQTCQKGIQLCYQLRATGELPNEDYIATAYSFLGRGYAMHKMNLLAKKCFLEAIKIKEDLLHQNKLPNPHSLKNLKDSLNKLDDADC